MTTVHQTFSVELHLSTGQIITKPINTLRQGDQEYVDLRSVVEGMYMSWPLWSMYLRGCAAEYGLVRHDDEYLRGTVLVKPQALPRLLSHLYNLPQLAQRWTARHRLLALQRQWFTAWVDRSGHPAAAPVLVPRKVTADVVRQLYERVKAGELVKHAAGKLGMSPKVARRVANGSYDMDSAATLAWCESFGGMRPPKTRETGVISRDRRLGRATLATQDLNGSQAAAD